MFSCVSESCCYPGEGKHPLCSQRMKGAFAQNFSIPEPKLGLTMKKMIITEFVQIFIVDVALLDVAYDVICLLIRHSWVELFTENH